MATKKREWFREPIEWRARMMMNQLKPKKKKIKPLVLNSERKKETPHFYRSMFGRIQKRIGIVGQFTKWAPSLSVTLTLFDWDLNTLDYLWTQTLQWPNAKCNLIVFDILIIRNTTEHFKGLYRNKYKYELNSKGYGSYGWMDELYGSTPLDSWCEGMPVVCRSAPRIVQSDNGGTPKINSVLTTDGFFTHSFSLSPCS